MDDQDWARITLLLETSDNEIESLHSYAIPPGMVPTMKVKFRGDFKETIRWMKNLIKATEKVQRT